MHIVWPMWKVMWSVPWKCCVVVWAPKDTGGGERGPPWPWLWQSVSLAELWSPTLENRWDRVRCTLLVPKFSQWSIQHPEPLVSWGWLDIVVVSVSNVVAPLSSLTSIKNPFSCPPCSTPVLAAPNLPRPFMLEVDASANGPQIALQLI